MRTILFSILLLGFSFLCFGSPIVKAEVDRDQLFLQDTLTLTITVKDTERNGATLSFPQLPQDFPFQVLRKSGPSVSTQMNVQILNGRQTMENYRTTTINLLLSPKVTGDLEIPALDLRYGETTLTTEPISIQVLDRQSRQGSSRSPSQHANAPSRPLLRQLLLSENTVVGSPVALVYEFLVPRTMRFQNGVPHLREEDFPQGIKVEGLEDSPWSESENEFIDGVPYIRFQKILRLTPRHPGDFTIPACIMTYRFLVENQQSRHRGRQFPMGSGFEEFDEIFANFGFGGMNIAEDTVVGAEVTLHVEDFPQEGRPENFTGLVGPLRANASVDLNDAFVGDPITLTLRLAGQNLDVDCVLPDLKEILEKNGDFRISGDDPVIQGGNGELLLNRTIRALSPGVKEVPGIVIPYYDLQKHAYASISTRPIPLKISEVRKVTLQDAQGTPPPLPSLAIPENARPAWSENVGIAASVGSSDSLLRNQWSPFPENRGRRGLLWWLLVPPVLWGTAAIFRWERQRLLQMSPAEKASRQAKGVLKERLAQIDDSGPGACMALGEALQQFLSQRLGLGGAITLDELRQALSSRKLSEAETEEIVSLLEECQAAQYGGLAAAPKELKGRILAAVERL